MANNTDNLGSPFKKPDASKRRLKAFFWGDSGSGKTTLSLRFPGVAVIDMEGGTVHYADDFDFEVLPCTSADGVMGAIDWLLNNDHDYRTLVIDPITVYWEALQKKWSEIFLKRNQGGKGYRFEFYDMQPRDWSTVKAEFKELIRKLINLDMNVIVTARSKAKYADGEFMRVIGETFDGEKSLPFFFDTVLNLERDGEKYIATVKKDRTHKLPGEHFEVDYGLMEECFGKDSLGRRAEKVEMVKPDQLSKLAFLIAELELKKPAVKRRLKDYNAESIADLTMENAEIIIGRLREAFEKKTKSAKEKTEQAGQTEQKEEGEKNVDKV